MRLGLHLNFSSRRIGAGSRYSQGLDYDFTVTPRSSATAHSLLTPYSSCLTALSMSQTVLSFLRQSNTNGRRLAFPLCPGRIFARVPCKCPPTLRMREVSAAS